MVDNVPAITRLEENLMRFCVCDFTRQTESVPRFNLTTTTIGINTQLVEQLHSIWQTITYLQCYTVISSDAANTMTEAVTEALNHVADMLAKLGSSFTWLKVLQTNTIDLISVLNILLFLVIKMQQTI